MGKENATKQKYWLLKSEPTAYSISDLKSDKRTFWGGIRNYQVRNMMRDEIKKGDIALFYHSNNKEIGVVGEMTVTSIAYADPSQFDPNDGHYDPKSKPEKPTWLGVDVTFKKKFPRMVALTEMRGEKQLTGFRLLDKGNRLSVVPVTKKYYEKIVSMSNKK